MDSLSAKLQLQTEYTDCDGFVVIDRFPTPRSDGNGLCDTFFYMTQLYRLGLFNDADLQQARAVLAACQVKGSDADYNRKAGIKQEDQEAQGQDDYMLLACFIAINEDLQDAGKALLAHALTPRPKGPWYVPRFLRTWCFNNKDTDTFSFRFWFVRHSGFAALIYAAAREPIPFVHRLYMAMSLLFTPSMDNATGHVLSWSKCIGAAPKCGRILRRIANSWLSRVRARPGGMATPLEGYFRADKTSGQRQPILSLGSY